MPTIRSTAELEALSAEAERRVRGGESRAEVARDIGVPLSTLADWAFKGGWRRKDIEAEQAQELTRLAHEKLAEQLAREDEAAAKSSAQTAMDVHAGLCARNSQPSRPDQAALGSVSPARLSMAMAHVLMEQGRLDDAERAARVSLRFMQALSELDAREERRRVAELRRAWPQPEAPRYPTVYDEKQEIVMKLDALLESMGMVKYPDGSYDYPRSSAADAADDSPLAADFIAGTGP